MLLKKNEEEILILLNGNELYTSEIAQHLSRLRKYKKYQFKQSLADKLMASLEQQGLVTYSHAEGRWNRKYYRITKKGQAALTDTEAYRCKILALSRSLSKKAEGNRSDFNNETSIFS